MTLFKTGTLSARSDVRTGGRASLGWAYLEGQGDLEARGIMGMLLYGL